jgi:hypothetical protein
MNDVSKNIEISNSLGVNGLLDTLTFINDTNGGAEILARVGVGPSPYAKGETIIAIDTDLGTSFCYLNAQQLEQLEELLYDRNVTLWMDNDG